ncbi:TIGR02588 family protein [Chthonobacter rhizosphaerae]|uniref:TIGR02588 family protein n=1 Tax=Chthonobacter rhizosphaerae TaxID=2735553 RepID=UPI0015EF4060|nr:TIGR02588 family protein [Chthonobacter rhizosphaerae]
MIRSDTDDARSRPDGSDRGRDGEGGAARRPATGTSPVEWAVAGLGGALLAAMIGYLVHDGLTGTGAPPDISVRTVSVTAVGEGHLVQVLVRNDGDSPAAAVDILAELKDGESLVEDATATLDYLPQQSARPAGFFFERNPADHALTVRATGYVDP